MFIERGVAAKPIPSGKGGFGKTGDDPLSVLFRFSSRKPAGIPAVSSPAHWPGRLAHLPRVWRVLRRVVASAELPTRFTASKQSQEGNFPFSGGGLQAGSQVSSPGRQLRMAGRRYFCDERAESCSVAGQSLQWEGQADGLCEFSLLLVRQSRFSLVSVGLEPKFSKVWNPSTPPDDRCARILSSRLSSHNSLAFSKDPEIYLLGQAGLPRSFPPMPGFYQ